MSSKQESKHDGLSSYQTAMARGVEAHLGLLRSTAPDTAAILDGVEHYYRRLIADFGEEATRIQKALDRVEARMDERAAAPA